MSNSASLNAINKIHINSSTKMTLSDRFTAFSERPKINPRTSREDIDNPVSRATSIANRRLLKQLAQKHTMEAALKLKRRSMKARPQPTTAAYKRVTNGQPLKRGSIKALRLGPSGRLLKANSISNVATMEADFLGRRSPKRANSVARISDRIGAKRLQAARYPRRVGGRPIWAANPQLNSIREQPPARMRSRSRSRTRQAAGAAQSPRLSQPGVSGRLARGRSNSRSRPMIRSRSRSRIDRVTRLANASGVKSAPITSRLGRRLGAPTARARSASRQGQGVARRSIRGGVASGRILKRRNSVKATSAKSVSLATGGVQSRLSRAKGRLPPAAANQRLNRSASKRGNAARGRARSRSRSRVDNKPLQRNNTTARGGATAANRQRGGAQRGRAAVRGTGRRGRSQQRGRSTTVGGAKGNGNALQQQRRGRSRSRGRGSARGGRQLGTDKPGVKKEDLDKELDQYMSSTKSSDVLFS